MVHLTKTLVVLIVCFSCLCPAVDAQTTAFTYQGKLIDGGMPPTGQYDFTFKLYDLVLGGTQVGVDEVGDNVLVTAGVFTVNLDFGSSPFTSTTGNYLEIAVRPGASTGTFTMLSPRQPITSSPYAVQTIRAASAAVADNAAQLGGVNASQYVQTTDARMSDARTPLAGSANYVQSNPATQQPGTNLNIGGNATVGGTISGNIVNAATQFNIAGGRILSNAGAGNLFAGISSGNFNTGSNNSFFGADTGFFNTTGHDNSFIGKSTGEANTIGFGNSFVGANAGQANMSGNQNSFFGSNAGFSNTTGSTNSFVGTTAGQLNTTGNSNSFFGVGAGGSNVTGGSNSFVGTNAGFLTTGNGNSFVGSNAGLSNTTGSNNTIIGTGANVAAGNLTNSTAIGSGAVVSTSNTIALGRSNGSDTVQIPGALNVAGTFGANIISAATQYSIGGNRVLSVAGTNNFFAGVGAGQSNTGTENSFVGRDAGQANTTGLSNAFFGLAAGQSNTTGSFNAFFGGVAGLANNNGSENAFFGYAAGRFNTSGGQNAFFGKFAGFSSETGSANSFFGNAAGLSNSSGIYNTFLGVGTGDTNTIGSDNTIVGANADVSINNLSNATAIGARATVSQSNSLVLGNNASVGIGTTAPAFKLEVVDSSNNGLRVQTNIAGGIVASFGGNGEFQVDATNIPGGRLKITESGQVSIPLPSGLILRSPNSACWAINVSDVGVLSTTSVTCP